MKKIIKIVLTSLLLLSVGNMSLSADAVKGQKLYLKKLKAACAKGKDGFNGIKNGADMAAKHSADEWKELYQNNKLGSELKKMCPKAKDKALKDKFMIHYYDFFKKYSNDSGNVPSC